MSAILGKDDLFILSSQPDLHVSIGLPPPKKKLQRKPFNGALSTMYDMNAVATHGVAPQGESEVMLEFTPVPRSHRSCCPPGTPELPWHPVRIPRISISGNSHWLNAPVAVALLRHVGRDATFFGNSHPMQHTREAAALEVHLGTTEPPCGRPAVYAAPHVLGDT